MELDNPQFGGMKLTKTSKARDIKHKGAKVSLITDTESMQHGDNPPVVLDKPKRMSGSGTAREMGEIFKAIGEMKRD